MIMNGKWLQEFDFKLDGLLMGIDRTNKLQITIEENNNFVARYLNLKMPNVYKGKIFSARHNSIVNMIFTSRDYFGAWTGKMISSGEIVGTWIDVAGQSGDFRLTRIK